MPINLPRKKRVSSVTFIPHEKQSFAEEQQTLDVKFCWAYPSKHIKDDFGLTRIFYTGLTDFLKCKDFLHDHVVASDYETSFSIFSYPAEKFPCPVNELGLIIESTECQPLVYETRLAACLSQFEKAVGLSSSYKTIRDERGKDRIILQPDPMYFKAPFGISMLSYLCRVTTFGGVWPTVIEAMSALQTKDSGIAATIKEYGVKKLEQKFMPALQAAAYPEFFSDTYLKKNSGSLHFSGGIQSTLQAAMSTTTGANAVAKHYGQYFA